MSPEYAKSSLFLVKECLLPTRTLPHGRLSIFIQSALPIYLRPLIGAPLVASS